MQILPVLVCLGLTSVVQATVHAIFSKPRLHLMHFHHNYKTPHTSRLLLPEERRSSSIFPKNNRKFVISLESHYKRNPMLSKTKKPVMKKLVIHEKKPDLKKTPEDQESLNAIMARSAQNFYGNSYLGMYQQAQPYVFSEEIESIEIVEDESKESYEERNDIFNLVKNNSDTVTTDNNKVRNYTSSTTEKFIEVNLEKNIEQILLDTSDISDKSDENDDDKLVDEKEYIFINTTPKDETITEIPEELDEFITTEEQPEISRKKRSDNVIEEENLATTVSGNKYTWRDTKLNNNLYFKNIHS